MTNEEIVKQIQSSGSSAELMAKLTEQLSGLVMKIAYHYSSWAELDDLIQESYFGVIEAVNAFDESQGASFATFAAYWIKATLRRYCENNGRTIRVPAGRIAKAADYKKRITDFAAINGKLPTLEEAAAWLGWPVKEVIQAQIDTVKGANAVSLSTPITDNDEDITLEDTLTAPGDAIEDATERIYQEELRELLWPIVDDLPGREGVVMRKRYQEGKTLTAIGEELGVSAEQIRRLEGQAIKRLQSGKKRKKLLDISGYYDMGLKGSGFFAFKNTGESSTERAAIKLWEIEDREERRQRMYEAVMGENL